MKDHCAACLIWIKPSEKRYNLVGNFCRTCVSNATKNGRRRLAEARALSYPQQPSEDIGTLLSF